MYGFIYSSVNIKASLNSNLRCNRERNQICAIRFYLCSSFSALPLTVGHFTLEKLCVCMFVESQDGTKCPISDHLLNRFQKKRSPPTWLQSLSAPLRTGEGLYILCSIGNTVVPLVGTVDFEPLNFLPADKEFTVPDNNEMRCSYLLIIKCCTLLKKKL